MYIKTIGIVLAIILFMSGTAFASKWAPLWSGQDSGGSNYDGDYVQTGDFK